VAPGGEDLNPYVLTSQDSKSLRVDLQKSRIEFGKHLIMQGSQKIYVNGKISPEYIKSVFLPYITKVLSEAEIEQEEAALSMDNYPGHLTSEMMDMPTTATFALHTAHIFQLLDLTLFGTFKRVGEYHLPFDDLTSTSSFIDRLYMDFKRTSIPANI
jgi:hypothetical protein